MKDPLQCVADAARVAILDEVAGKFLAALPRDEWLPFALAYSVDAICDATSRFLEQVGPNPTPGTKATVELRVSYELDFYGIRSKDFEELVLKLADQNELLDSVLARRGLERAGPLLLRHAALRSVFRTLGEVQRDDDAVVSSIMRQLGEVSSTPTVDDVVRAVVSYMGENRPRYEKSRAIRLACQVGLGETLTSVDQDYEKLAGGLAGALNDIAKGGLPNLDTYHLHLLAEILASLHLEAPDDLARRLHLAHAACETDRYEQALDEGTLRLGQRRVFQLEPEDGPESTAGSAGNAEAGAAVGRSREPTRGSETTSLLPCPACNEAGQGGEEAGACPRCGGLGTYSPWGPYFQRVFQFDATPCESCNETGTCSICDGRGFLPVRTGGVKS